MATDARHIPSFQDRTGAPGLINTVHRILRSTSSEMLVNLQRGVGSPSRGISMIRTLGPQTHRLPFRVMWGITLLTAVSMALINFCTIWIISSLVEHKFKLMQFVIDDRGVVFGALTLVGVSMFLAVLCTALIFCFAPNAGNSGAPENKGWLNGNSMPGLFTFRHMTIRAFATILANASGYPVGREGPTVTMGSNLAFLLTHSVAEPYVRQWVDLDMLGSGCSAALMIDEERLAHAKRIVCTVGGACGMAMLFDSPIGGILYMFEEITAASWPLEVTTRAFAGTTVCALMSRALLNLCGTTTKAFVVYEWNPQPQPWSWGDVPFFIMLAILLGPFSAFHTRACLAVAAGRQQLMTMLHVLQPWAKIFDAIFYAGLCAAVYTSVAMQARCFELPWGNAVEFVRFHCPEGEYNPVASLLLTTSEGAVKRLFSVKNVNEIHLTNEVLAFCAYTTLNICLTGIAVPSGNFTGSMLIGGLAGRIMGALVRTYATNGVAVSGVYAMVGSAAMLAGFKQMSVAVVVFIMGCANDLDLIPPLMISVTIALLLNQSINDRGFDEEQIARKKIPFLPAEPPSCMDHAVAMDLCDDLPEDAVLTPEASGRAVRMALAQDSISDFPVVRPDKVCIGFTTRARLEAAMKARESDLNLSSDSVQEDADEPMGMLMSGSVGRQYSLSGTLLPVERLAEKSPYTILQDMPAPRLFAIFSKAGARAAAVVSETGELKGMISRAGLIVRTRQYEEMEAARLDMKDEDDHL